MLRSPAPVNPPDQAPLVRGRGHLLAAAVIFAIALAVRLPHIGQSLWFDEMTTLLEYVLQPWQKILAAHPGQYVPNNHVLHTILAKLLYTAVTGGHPTQLPVREAMLRLPALLAGALLPAALAWPFRQTEPRFAVLLAAIAVAHPWLVAFSDEARGYTLLLLLGVLATNRLPDGRRRWPIGYALLMAAAFYTLIIAAVLLAAHGLAVALLRRRAALAAWARGAGVAIVIALLLYLPMMRAMVQYYRNPFPATGNYAEFLNQLPRYVGAGERLPRRDDPVEIPFDAPSGTIYWALPVLALAVGSGVGWLRPALRPMLATLAIATVLSLIAPLWDRAAGQVRFVPWAGVWVCVALAALLLAGDGRAMRAASVVGVAAVLGWMGWRDAVILPFEPVRQAIAQADHLAPAGADLVATYLGSREAVALYPDQSPSHVLLAAPDLQLWKIDETAALSNTGQRPWVIFFYENLAYRRSRAADSLGMWDYLQQHYRLVRRVDGQIPVGIYAPTAQASVAIGTSPGLEPLQADARRR